MNDPEKLKRQTKDALRDIQQCSNCKFCLPSCPVYRGWFSQAAPGKMRAFYYFLKYGYGKPEDLQSLVYYCTTCANCETACRAMSGYVPVVEIVENIRTILTEKGIGPLSRQKDIGDHVKSEYNPYMEKHQNRLDWLPKNVLDKLPKKAKYVYFVGCTSSFRQKTLARDTVNVLLKAGVDFTILGLDEWCCGSPLLRTGQINAVRELAAHNTFAIEKVGADTVITSCAGCYRTFQIDYKKQHRDTIDLDFPFTILHTTDLIKDLLSTGELKFKNNYNKIVTYHDPCHLGRHAGMYDTPRQVLKMIPGLQLVEMPRIRESSWCCGAGGGFRSGYSDVSMWVAGERVKEAENTGAEVVASSCPFCWRNLNDAIKESQSNLIMKDVIQIISEIC